MLLGFWLLRVADAPRSVQLQQVVVTTVAAATFVVVVRGRGWRSTGDSQWPPLALAASLFIPMLAGASAGPERWLVLGGTRLYVAPIVLPILLFLLGAAQPPAAIYAASVVTVALALAIQPDASQVTAFALAMLVLLSGWRAHPLSRLALWALLLCAAVAAWRTPDPLAPVRYVEGVFDVAASVSPLALLATLVSIALPVIALVHIARATRSRCPLAVAVYYATLFALAPLQTTPVPLLGFGAGPILGYLLVASVVSRSFVSQAAAHSMAAQAERVH